jgi:hypothetical protein
MSDGAVVNGASIHEFEKELDTVDDGWDAREHNILCKLIQSHFCFH